MTDEQRQDDDDIALGAACTAQKSEYRNYRGQEYQLSNLDAHVERRQREQIVVAGKLQILPEREREAEPVH